jgi:hypothetical protein
MISFYMEWNDTVTGYMIRVEVGVVAEEFGDGNEGENEYPYQDGNGGGLDSFGVVFRRYGHREKRESQGESVDMENE